MPEYGRTNVFKVSPFTQDENSLADTVAQVGGQVLFRRNISMVDLTSKVNEGYVFRQTKITPQYGYKQYREEKGDSAVFLYLIKRSGQVRCSTDGIGLMIGAGDVFVCLPPAIGGS